MKTIASTIVMLFAVSAFANPPAAPAAPAAAPAAPTAPAVAAKDPCEAHKADKKAHDKCVADHAKKATK